MTRKAHHPWSLAAASLLLLAVVSLGCISIGAADADLPEVDAPKAQAEDRQDCRAILGSAFRSANEREWYMQNCSKWPLVSVPQGNPGAAGAPPPDNRPPEVIAECDKIRGKPYESTQQQQWYLQNCLTPNPPSNQAQQQPTSGAPPPPGAGDRTNCDEIRGTPYRSDAERGWYVASCSGQNNNSPQQQNAQVQGQSNQQPPPPPVPGQQQPTQQQQVQQQQAQQQQSTCQTLRTRGYRNAQERSFYLEYCR